jgi:predicted transglutaminase-like cysteine proteinase
MSFNIKNDKRRAEKLEIKTLNHTKRMLQLCDKSERAGIKTLDLLYDQGVKLKGADKSLDNIKHDLATVENNLKTLKKPCLCCCCCCFSRKGKEVKRKKENSFSRLFSRIFSSNKKGEDSNEKMKKPFCLVDTNENLFTLLPQSQVNLDKQSSMSLSKNSSSEDAITTNLFEIRNHVSNLKLIALAVGSELNSQISHIERIDQQTNNTVDKVSDADKMGKVYLNEPMLSVETVTTSANIELLGYQKRKSILSIASCSSFISFKQNKANN